MIGPVRKEDIDCNIFYICDDGYMNVFAVDRYIRMYDKGCMRRMMSYMEM